MKKIILFIGAILSFAVAFAQPSITSFAPSSGVAGTPITISGVNFDPTPANNIVKFNGTTAVVTASTSTSITTSVPSSATSGLISVTVGGNTATSTNVFCVPNTPASSEGLIVSYNFNGNFNDGSGNNNNGVNNGVTLVTDRCGNPNSAIFLNGTSTSHVTIPTSASMESIISTQEMTVSAWFSSAGNPVFPILERYNPNVDNGMLIEVNTYVGGTLLNTDYAGSNTICSHTWVSNEWHQISITYSKAKGLASFYVDGILICSNPFTQSITTDIARDFFIGTSLSGPDEFTYGAIDDFKFYNRALSDCEVASIYSTTSITSFTPSSGQFGTPVTITGTNFDPAPANNVVKFNGVNAVVTSSTSTSISTTVPVGATSGPISVAVNCSPVVSSTNFVVNYAVPFGNTVTLNGTTDYIKIGDQPALRPTDLTLEAWINFSSSPGGQVIIGKALSTSSDNNSYALYYLSGSLRGFVNNNALQNTEITYPWSPIVGQWYHVAFTFNSSTKAQTLYLNGAVVAANTTVASPDYTTTPVSIGADLDFGTFDGFVSGKIDEARIWNVTRTQSQIQTTLNTTLVGNETGLAAYYKMDESGAGAGIVVKNSATSTGTTLNGITVGTTCTPIFTPPPTITSFSPTTGPVGKSVVITGTNFGTTLSNNVVTFNGVQATVTASTPTSITVIVPATATTGLINVTIGCGSISSSSNFIVVPPVPITISSQPVSTAACDGDVAQFTTAASGTTNITYQWQKLNTDASSLNGLRWEIPAISSVDANIDNVVDPATVSATMGGVAGTSYSVALRFRGVVETKAYSGGTTNGFWNEGGIPDGGGYDIYELDVSDPQRTYYLNAGVSSLTYAFAIDYQQTVTINAGATVQLKAFTIDNTQVKNKDQFGAPIIIPGIPPAPAAFNGQFIQMDVVSINGSPFTNISDNANYSGTTTSTLSINTAAGFGAGDYRCNISGDLAVDTPTNTVTLVVNTRPSAPSTTGASACASASVMLTASGATNGQYRWYTTATGGTAISGEVNSTYTTLALSSNTNYYVTIFNGTCESTRTLVTAVINSTSPPTVTSASSCSPSALTLTASGGLDGQYKWYTSSSGGTALAGESHATYTTPLISDTSTYYVSIDNGVCESNRTATTATINTLSAPTTTNASGCSSTTITLTASGGTNGQYRWYTVSSGGTAISGQVNNTFITPVLTSTTQYFVSINNSTCESTRTVVTATINNLPTAPTTTGASGCSSTAITLTASGGTNGQYRWYSVSSGGSALSGQVNNTFITPSLNATTSYYVSINNGTCESTRTSVTAIVQPCVVNQPPDIKSTTVEAPVEGKVTVSLTALISDPDNNLDLSTLKIIVQPSSGAIASIDAQRNLILDYTNISFSGIEKLTIQVCDLLGACTQKELSIEVIGDVIVYNGISPNNDGENDIFIIKYIDVLEDTKTNHVFIYNRWGDLVFDTIDYDNKDNSFKGLNNNGNEIPSGTYFYKVEFNNGRKNLTGYLAVKR